MVCYKGFRKPLKYLPITLLLLAAVFLCSCGGGASAPPLPVPQLNPVPTISSLTPTSIIVGEAGSILTINGGGFIQGSTARWNQSNRITTFVSSTQLQVAVTAGDLAVSGTAQVTVTNPAPGGGSSVAAIFTINNPAPQISSVSSGTVTTIAAGSKIIIAGSGFVSTSTVMWNGATHAFTYVSATELQFTLLPSDVAIVGSASVSVVNPGPGGGSASPSQINIVYPVPTISALNPAAVGAGGRPFVLTVSGAGYSPSSAVYVDGAIRTTSFVNSNTLTIILSSSDIAAPATVQITVVTGSPGGGTSSPAVLTIDKYPVPSIVSLSPSSIPINSPDTLITIQGAGFTQFSTVQVNGNSLNLNGGSPNFLFFTLPAADLTALGSLSITVSNPGSISNSMTLSVIPNPVPVLSGIFPSSAAVGGPTFQLAVSGSNFVPTSDVLWNGSPRPTNFINANQLTATIYASDIQSLGNKNVTISNPSPGGGASSALGFVTYISLPANDLVYSPTSKLIYVSVPSSAGPSLGNSIVSIDPYTGVLGAPVFVGSEPGKMALSGDGSVIWVALNGAAAVRKVDLNTHTAGLQFSLGGGIGVYNPPIMARALAVMPGFPDTVAVATPSGFFYDNLVTIYDNGIARVNAQNAATQCCSGLAGLAFDASGTKLYEAGSGYGMATVNNTGIISSVSLNPTINTNDLRIDNGRAYLTSGLILDADSGTQLGVFSVSANQNAFGTVAPDSSIGKAFVVVDPNFGTAFQINAYDLSTFVLIGSSPVVNLFGQYPSSLRRWGQDGLAFTTGAQIYIFRSPLVRDLSTSLADLNVTAVNPPGNGTTGANLTYTLKVTNSGPLTAAPATLADNIPDGASLLSVTTSQGTCNSGAAVFCNLGDLISGGSATIQITVTALSPGRLTNTALVSAPQADPNPADNSLTSTTIVTGSVYNPMPAVTSISPAFVQAGSNTFTLTVNGSGFSSGSIVRWNSVPLVTTFVSASQLSAAVDANQVAALGWSWVDVSNPNPGGGDSSRVPFTIYKVISLDVNRLNFDPFTGKLYASVPSTATQLNGNSLVAVDPATGSLGTPINLGSEPNRTAESSDGKYLYIGLDGSKSLTRVDLTSLTQGPVYPLLIPGTSMQFAARDLAVAPGNDNLLAIDPGYASDGVGLVDISGSTATMRPVRTGIYTGSNVTFANPTTVYTYDSDTSGAEFYRWAVTSTGLTLNNNTGYTLNGIGGFGGAYKVVDGLVYGFGGGVADPSTAPPKQLGQFSVSSAQGNSQVIQGTGVAPDPPLGRVFILGETLAGSADPVLFSYDSDKYVLLNMQQFTGALQGQDLLRWGRDGLAWHTSNSGPFGNNTPGLGQIFLMRGPFVLPQWNSINPTPGIVSASPSSVTAGNGNFTLTITGSNFVPGAVMTWNGGERTTTFVDSSHLTVALPASDVALAGTATLNVNNPGSANSGSISFAIN